MVVSQYHMRRLGMGKRTMLGSSIAALMLAALVYFAIYFFVPSLSDPLFGISYQGKRDVEQLQQSVADILEKSRVPQVAIEQYISQFDTHDFYLEISEKSREGQEAVLDLLQDMGEGIDFTSLETSELKGVLAEGFSEASRFTRTQLKALQRLVTGALDSL